MTTNTHPVTVLTLPRPMREIVARLTTRIALKGHGLSAAADEAIQLLLTDSDRVELTPLQAAAVTGAMNAARAKVVVPDSSMDVALRHLAEQLSANYREQLVAARKPGAHRAAD